MIETIRQLITPPHFPNKEKTRVAYILHASLLTFLVIVLGAGFSFQAAVIDGPIPAYVTPLPLLIFFTICLVTNKMGRTHLTALVITIVMWVCLVGLALAFGGISTLSLPFFFTIIAFAYATLGKRGGVLTTALSALGITLVYILEEVGVVEPFDFNQLPNANLLYLIAFIFSILSASLLYWLASNTLDEILKDLRRSEERYRLLVDLSADAAYIHDLNGIILEVNERACQTLGLERSEVIGRHVSMLDITKPPELLGPAIKLMLVKVPVSIGGKVRRYDGKMLDIQTNAVKINLHGEPVIYGLTRDVTEQRATERALRASKRQFDLLERTVDGTYWVMSAETGQLTYISPAGERLLNNSAADIINDPSILWYAIHPEDRARHGAVHREAIDKQQKEELDIEYRLISNGNIRWLWERSWGVFDEEGRLESRAGLTIDITARRQVDQLLRSTTERLQILTNNLPARIAYFDQDARIVFLNEQFKEIGMDPDALVGLKLEAAAPRDVYKRLEPHLDKALGGETVEFENIITPYGEERYTRNIYVPQFDNDNIVGVIALTIDVTEQRRAEEALQHSQKLESLGLLAGGIAHDFNNLLVAMLGQASLARHKMGPTHKAHRHIDKVVQAAERAGILTQQMLAYSGRGQFEVRQINFNQLIEDNLKLFEASLGKHIELQTDFARNLPLVEADTAQMQQVIMNLIINAAQAIGEQQQGRIAITTGTHVIDESSDRYWRFTGDRLNHGHYVTLEVQDNGCGMDEATQAKIFDPFFTTKSNGSGLGLAAVLGILRGHHGGIRIYSEMGRGTAFRLLFPVSETKKHQERIERLMTETHLSLLDSHILIIDDEPDVAEAISDMLDTEGIHSIVAQGGRSGVDLYQQNQTSINLVLLDLSMPEMDGEQVFHALRDINPTVNVVLSSGFSQLEATRRFVDQGLAGFLQKPYNLDTLVNEIKIYLAK